VTVDDQPSRVWDWRDPQLLRTWKAGPAKSNLKKRWQELWDERKHRSLNSLAENHFPSIPLQEDLRHPLAPLEREYSGGHP